MGSGDFADDLDLAHRLASASAEISMSWFGRDPAITVKPDGTKVTAADLEVEAELRRLLREERPDDGVLGEEFDQTAPAGTTRGWIIDPIDGTNTFIEGGTTWGTLIALQSDGRLTVGVVDQPIADRRSWASAGEGAFRRERNVVSPMHVSAVQSIGDARSTPVPSDTPPELRPALEALWSSVTVPEPPQNPTDLDHPGLLVASGRSDFAVTFGQPWDIAAIAVIVTEAGGCHSTSDGRSSINSGCAIFSNGLMHGAVLDAFQT